MQLTNKSKLFGNILSDGSLVFRTLSSYQSQRFLNSKKIDLLNHPVWTGKRPSEQTEISSFINRLNK
uniref:Ribosomal protein L31 n=1 Tax=Colpomenia peregrina TaxID=27965 RepID=A0A0U1XGS1_9PHAE|nr:ribosomal protein L31 [Colpomenia peregrina]AIR12199.1 ribosomal protein L31 [Colpomenia peregrina]WVH38402.1 ribosomal protein L31 [Colpomenia sinuosa]